MKKRVIALMAFAVLLGCFIGGYINVEKNCPLHRQTKEENPYIINANAGSVGCVRLVIPFIEEYEPTPVMSLASGEGWSAACMPVEGYADLHVKREVAEFKPFRVRKYFCGACSREMKTLNPTTSLLIRYEANFYDLYRVIEEGELEVEGFVFEYVEETEYGYNIIIRKRGEN